MKKSGPKFSLTVRQALCKAKKDLVAETGRGRLIARVINSSKKRAVYIFEADVRKSGRVFEYNFRRGGCIRMKLSQVSQHRIQKIQKEMEEKVKFRQYTFRSKEPRLHALYSNNPGNGYKYHGVEMKAEDLQTLPVTSKVSKRLAKSQNIKDWNIGADMLLYRDGQDSINFHADNTQKEEIVIALVVTETCRPLCVKPANGDLDEQLEIFPTAGDSYQMDGTYLNIQMFCFYVFMASILTIPMFFCRPVPYSSHAKGVCSCDL